MVDFYRMLVLSFRPLIKSYPRCVRARLCVCVDTPSADLHTNLHLLEAQLHTNRAGERARKEDGMKRVFLPALATSRAGIHTLYAWFVWERSMRHRLSRKPIARIAIFFRCARSAPGRLSSRREPSPALLAGLVPLPPRRSGHCTRGVRSWICWRVWRRVSPYRTAVSSPRGSGSTVRLSSSEGGEVEIVDTPQSVQYEELLEVVTRAVEKLKIDWPAESQAEPQRSRLEESQSRPVTHCQAVSTTAGSDGGCVQRDTFWPAVHETPTVVAQNQEVLPEGKPASHDQGHAAMPTCLGHVEESLVPVSGAGAGSSLSPCNASNRCFPHRLGCGHEWPHRPRSVERSPTHLAHKLPGDAGRVPSAEALSPGPKRPSCVGPYRQHIGGLLHQPPGRSAFAPLVQAGAPDPCVVPGQTPLAESGLLTGVLKCGSRHPVETGAEARGMDASPRGGEADLESFWSSPSGPFCHEGEHAMSPLVLSSSSSSPGAGCHGTDVAEASSVRLSPDRSAPGSSRESAPGRGVPPSSSPVLAGPSMVLGPDFSPRRLSMGDSRQEGSPLTGGGYCVSPSPGAVETLGVAPEGAHLLASGLSTEVVETILQSRAPSTRKLYALKWRLFTSWCERHQQDPVNCPVGTVLEFLQDRLSAGLSHSTLKVYVAAIAAYHAPLGGLSVGKDPPCLTFPPRCTEAEASCTFSCSLMGLVAGARGSLELGISRPFQWPLLFWTLRQVWQKLFLHPRSGYIPKVPSSAPRPVVLQAFCPPPFREPDQQKLNCMCPVRALDTYVHRAARWRKSDQLFVCYGPAKRGFPATKQTLSRWIVDAISTAYESSGLPPPLGVKAHSTRSVSASKAFLEGVSIQDICNAAGWSTPLTFLFLGRDSASGGVGISFPKRFDAARVPEGERLRLRNETPRLEALILHPCERCFSPEADAGLQRTCIYSFLVGDVTRR
ncbi:tRNA-5-methyluridine(54) 2-sulfurtransferase [Labeo rohita]|uniref:tRNA-5-methyluridine(54) 2-sulfurtransferase n=1 Tax=Labeo rohita TaxID=84645 RepID=A0ABQ8M8W0_LABRO|nr:tRNA-5-methyluridine(54) 2-sulfurtransferase [Labeo rohita]